MRRRPNPFTSWEGCFLSNTVWGVSFLIALTGGAYVGSLLGGQDGGTMGAALAAGVVTFTPWRRWILAGLRRLRQYLESDEEPPSS
ncbi:MAG: hypothetical protein HYY02_05785 [Chloroflexi bacterium]|nr:hypothetical protein [Chloroflexota bacterium]